jgi:alpha-tubulin suppressor-like RCC1 family protein
MMMSRHDHQRTAMRDEHRVLRLQIALAATAFVVACLLAFTGSAKAGASSGSVSSWGDNTYGELGDGYEGWSYDSKVPVPVSGLSGAKSVAAGGAFGLALLQDGTVEGWGNNGAGELGDATFTQRDTPVAVSGLSSVKQIAAGDSDSYALLENGTVEAWGYDDEDQLGPIEANEICDSGVACVQRPTLVPGLSGVKAIAAGESYTLVLLEDGTVEAWGEGSWGQLGNGPVKGLEICPGEPDAEGSRLCSKTPVQVNGLSGVAQIAAGHGDSLALLENGTVMSWGYNGAGQLGNATTEGPEWCVNGVSCSGVPVSVSGLSGVTQVSAGDLHCLALLGDGTVMAWGNGESGHLGDGTTENSDVPVPVSGLSGVTQISAGEYHSLALLSDGTVEAWGWDILGQLGNVETEEESDVPVPVTGLSGATAIAAGSGQSYAVGATPVAYPQIASIDPYQGPEAGGTSVTITGINFTGATKVEFASKEATSFTVNSPTSITAVSPPGTGEVEITVTTPEGTSHTGPRDTFTYGEKKHVEEHEWPWEREHEPIHGGSIVSDESASDVTEHEATIKASVNPQGTTAITYFVEYGTTAAYGQSAPNPPATIRWFTCGLECAGENETPRPVSVTLTGLEAGTTYHYRLVASDGNGPESSGEDSTFTTQSAPASSGGETQPSIDSESVSDIGEHDATLEAQIDQNGRYTGYEFQIDTTGSFDFSGPVCPFSFPGDAECDAILASGETMPGGVEPQPQYLAAATGAETITLDLASIGVVLQPGTTYHYRVIATAGGAPVLDGPDQTFTTTSQHARPLSPEGEPLGPKVDVSPGGGDLSATPKYEAQPQLEAKQDAGQAKPASEPAASTKPATSGGVPGLAKALKRCQKKPRGKRATCEKQVKRSYVSVARERGGLTERTHKK